MNSFINKGTSVLNTPLNLSWKTYSKSLTFLPKDATPVVVLSNYFNKKGDFVQSWKSRYFVLYKVEKDDDIIIFIQYFTSSNLKSEKGSIYPIKDVSRTTSTSFLKSSKEHGITISTGRSRKYYLSSTDETTVNKWIQTLNALLQEVEVETIGYDQTEVSEFSDDDEEFTEVEDPNDESDSEVDDNGDKLDSDEEDAQDGESLQGDSDSDMEIDEPKPVQDVDTSENEGITSHATKIIDKQGKLNDDSSSITIEGGDSQDLDEENNQNGNPKENKLSDIGADLFMDSESESTDSDSDWNKVTKEEAPDLSKAKQSISSSFLSRIGSQLENIERQGSQARLSRIFNRNSNKNSPSTPTAQPLTSTPTSKSSPPKNGARQTASSVVMSQVESTTTDSQPSSTINLIDTSQPSKSNLNDTTQSLKFSDVNNPLHTIDDDLSDPSKPLDVEKRLFSLKEVEELLSKDRVRRLNYNISKKDIISPLNKCDELQLHNEKYVINIMQAYDDEDIHFSGIIKVKYNGKFMNQVVVLTSQSILIFSRREVNALGVDSAPLSVVPFSSSFSTSFGAPLGKAVFNTLTSLNPLDIAKKRVTYDFKDRIELRSVNGLLLSQAPEQTQLLSILVPVCETDLLLDFSANPSKKDEFIQYILSLYRVLQNRKLEYTTVFNILDFTRIVSGESKPTPVSYEDDEIIQSTPFDFLDVAKKLSWRKIFKQYGETGVLFSQMAEKIGTTNTPSSKKDKVSAKVLVAVTKNALYICSNEDETVVKRRIELDDIKELGIELLDNEIVLIHIPKEYDILLNIKNREEFIQTLKVNVEVYENATSKANFSKVEYNKKERQMNDAKVVLNGLNKAIKELSRYKIQLYIDKAHAIKGLDEEVKKAQEILKDMDQSDMLRKEWNKAWREVNLSYMNVILRRAQKVAIMKDFYEESEKKLNRLINYSILTQRIRDTLSFSLEDADETTVLNLEQIENIYSILKRANLKDLLEDFTRQVDLQNQQLQLIKNAKRFIAEHDRDGLIFVKENAKRLKITSLPILSEVEKKYNEFAKEDENNKLLKLAIEYALDTDEIDGLQEALEISKQIPYSSTQALIQKGNETISYILQRVENRRQFENDLSSKMVKPNVLQEWIDKTKNDDYFDALRLNAEKILHGQMKHKNQIIKLREKFKDLLNTCKRSDDEKHEAILKEMLTSTRHIKELEPLIKVAEVMLTNRSKKREVQDGSSGMNSDTESLIFVCSKEVKKIVEANTAETIFVNDIYTRATQLIKLRKEIQDAIQSQKRSRLQRLVDDNLDCLKEDELLLTEANQALEKMKEQANIKNILDQFVINNSSSTEIKSFLSSIKDSLTEELQLKADAILGLRMENEKTAAIHVSALESVLSNWSKNVEYTVTFDDPSNPIQKILAEAKPFAIYNPKISILIETIIKKAQNKIIDEEKSQRITLSNNPYINDIHHEVLVILKSFGENDVTVEGKFIVQHSQYKNLTTKIYGILTHRLKSFFFRERTFFDVCKSLQMQGTQYALRVFETNSPPQKDPNSQSFLFFQFLLENDYFTHCMQELFTQAQFIAKCYNTDSILYNERNREELLTVFLLMNQFKFQSSAPPKEEDSSITNPISLLKQTVQNIVLFYKQLYEENKASKSKPEGELGDSNFDNNVEIIGDDEKYPELRHLVEKLSNCLLEIFQNSRKVSIYKSSIWTVIQKIAQQRETEAVIDIGGIALPDIVHNVKEIVRFNGQQESVQGPSRKSDFLTFITYSLNTNQLGNVIESILRDTQLPKYYSGNHALVLQPETRELLVSLLHKLDFFSFHLAY